MKRDALRLSQHQFIETARDHNGRFFIAYSGGASVYVRDIAELRRFLKVPKGLAMRAALDSWLDSLADQDAEKKAPMPAAVDLQQTWGPEGYLDETDPNHNTKTVI
jgi:hypothetical protein